MKNLLIPLIISVLLIVVSANNGYATTGPRAFLDEYVAVDYDYDGTPSGDVSRTGYVRVTVPNEDDVLQYIKITLANYNPNTTIANLTSYKNVVTSYPTVNATSNIYVNTSAGYQQSNYVLNDTDAAPTINLSITWSNEKGGTDLYDSDNLYYTENNITFNVTIRNPSGEKNLSNVNVTIYFAQDTSGGNDAVEILQMLDATTLSGVSHGTMDSWDNDGDGAAEAANWVGTLGHDTETQRVVYLRFYVNITEGTNFADGGDTHDVDGTSDKGGNANYTSSGSTLTGTTISNKLSRGDVRQGVDLSIKGGYWHVRGFIRNMANSSGYMSGDNLTYNLSLWKIREIKDDGTPFPVANKTGHFGADPEILPSDGRIYTTDSSRSNDTIWFNTTLASGSKPFFAIEMDWEVIWDTQDNDIYTGYINTTLNLPTLDVIDLVHIKGVSDGYVSPDTGNENVTFNDNATFVGGSGAPAKHIEIYSLIPGQTIVSADKGDWNVFTDSLRLYYVNQTGTYQLNISQTDSDQTAITVTVTDPVAGGSGQVNVSIYDISLAQRYGKGDTIGNYFNDAGGNDKLWLVYVVGSSSEMSTGDNYLFDGNVTMTTDTGTPLIEDQINEYVNVSGRRLIGWKELIAKDPSDPSLINATVLVEVQDGTGNGITGIKFIDYVPNWTMNLSQYQGNISVFFYNGASWAEWTQGTDFKVTDNGTTTLPDGTLVHIFEIINASAGGDTWNLTDGQFINVTYEMRVSDSGLYVLPTIIAAFDPTTGEQLGTIVYGVIKVLIPEPLTPLQITEDDLGLAKRVIVGKPAVWIKQFDVYNPNSRPAQGHFETLVFNDVMDGSSVSYYNDMGERVDVSVTIIDAENGRLMVWDDTINALESRAYEVRVLTPPVLEIDRDIEVLEKLENRMVKLKMDVYLKNFAEESYENLILNLPIGYENILEVRDAFGKSMAFTGGIDSSSITVDSMEADGMKTITVIYEESYPTIIITPDRDRYDLNAPVNLEILVINGGDEIEYPYLEVEIYTPQMDVIFTNIEKLEGMEPLEKTETYEKFVIPAYAPGGMYIASAKFREDFVTLASATGNFLVMGSGGAGIPESVQVLIVIIVILVLAYFSIKRVREVRKNSGRTGIVNPLEGV
jgi:hypothetical protein